ncbi:MAG: hypothetical protein KKB20_00105 [Proteobacteria bacterium]|nr:hypothetical protein [Pseudomonadota bacterium]
MTHTLNRTGLSPERPGQEIVILIMAHHKIKADKGPQMVRAAETVLKYGPDNFIGLPLGLTPEQLIPLAAHTGIVTAVFRDLDTAAALVAELKAQENGVSVVLSGLFDDVRDVCRRVGLTEHTTHVTAGVFGRTELLPEGLTLDITTQCGHALVSRHYVADLVKKIRKGKLTPREGAELLAKPCVCGVVNKTRTAEILDRLARKGAEPPLDPTPAFRDATRKGDA